MADLTSVSVMLEMFVDFLRWVEHYQKVVAVTGKIQTHHLDKVGVVTQTQWLLEILNNYR